MFTSVNGSEAFRPRSTPPTASGGVGHVTPKRELQSYLAVTLREREWNERDAARDRANTGVYVFTCVNMNRIREFNAKGLFAVTGAVTRGCCGVNVLKAKDRCWNRRPGALRACSLRCAVRKGSPLRSDR